LSVIGLVIVVGALILLIFKRGGGAAMLELLPLVLLAVVTLLTSLGPVLLPIGILAAASLGAWLWLAPR